MSETPSKTANHQRLKEMLIHLTPLGATVPYSVCIDCDGNFWVAAKGGLFKLDRAGNVLYSEKNHFTRKAAPFCQVLHHQGKLIYATAEDAEGLTQFRIMNSSGKTISEQFIDGKIQNLTVSPKGEIFMTKRLQGDESVIYKTDIDNPVDWEVLISSDDFAFQIICPLPDNLLLSSTCSIPVNMYSKQHLRLIDLKFGEIVETFSEKGKNDGQIYFPLSIKNYNEDNFLVLDKTGRIQQFTSKGEFVRVAAKIDAYLGNAFVVDGDSAVLACSGIVLDQEKNSICDDWLEKVPLDGSEWLPDSDHSKTK